MLKVSAVIPTFKRPKSLRRVLDYLSLYPQIDDVVIWDNVQAENVGVFGRYVATKFCKHDIIYTQDDDVITYNLPDLFSAWDGSLTALMKPQSIKSYQEKTGGKVCLVGTGSLWKKSATKVFGRYLKKYGVDELLKEECDRLFTFFNQPHTILPGKVEDLPVEFSGLSEKEGHWQRSLEMIRRCESLSTETTPPEDHIG